MGARAGFLAFALGVTFVTTAACGSVPDITFDDGDAGANGEAGVVEGGIDPNCQVTGSEICDDGIDNDCNGLTDCADPRCRATGFSCQDVPMGWTLVSFSATQKPPCPSNLRSTDLKVSGGDGGSSCSCSCVSVGGSCTSGNFTVTVSGDPACATNPDTQDVSVNSGNCSAIGGNLTLPANAHAKITPPSTATSCKAEASVNGPITQGRMCQPERVGLGCDANQACVLRTTIGLATCITQTGKSACPSGFTKRSTAGTNVNDSRSCGGCTGGAPGACTGGSVTLFDNFMCKSNGGNKSSGTITSACAQTDNSNITATHFESTPPTGGGCSSAPTSQPVPQGGLAFMEERTICCR